MKKLIQSFRKNGRLNTQVLLVCQPAIIAISLISGILGAAVSGKGINDFFSGFTQGFISISLGCLFALLLPARAKVKILRFNKKYVVPYLKRQISPEDNVVVKISRESSSTSMVMSRDEWNDLINWYNTDTGDDGYVIKSDFINGIPSRSIRLNRDNIVEIQMFEVTPLGATLRVFREVFAQHTALFSKTVYLLTFIWVIGFVYMLYREGLNYINQFTAMNPYFITMSAITKSVLNAILYMTIIYIIISLVRGLVRTRKQYLVYSEKTKFSGRSLILNTVMVFCLLSLSGDISNGILYVVQNVFTKV